MWTQGGLRCFVILGKMSNCFFRHTYYLYRLLRKAATSLRTQGSSISVYLRPLLAAISVHISLSCIYSTWREDAVLAEQHGSAVGVPCTAWTDFHSVLLLIYGKGQTGGERRGKKKRKKKKEEKTTVLKKNRTKIWCGKVNYNRLVILMLLKWFFFQ